MNSTPPDCTDTHPEKVVVIFQPSVAKCIASSATRLPANFVGVRYVRPSIIASTKENSSPSNTTSTVKFVVVENDGTERRMTKAEKKAKKREMELEKKQARQKRKLEQSVPSTFVETSSETVLAQEDVEGDYSTKDLEPTGTELQSSLQYNSSNFLSQSKSYHQMPLNKAAMEEEMEEGTKSGLCPAILSAPMALQFLSDQNSRDTSQSASIVYNHSLSCDWAEKLHKYRVLPAEEIRSREDLRPLAYKLKPEPWQRLRPNLELNSLRTFARQDASMSHQPSPNLNEEVIAVPESCQWTVMTCRPTCPPTRTINGRLPHDHVLSIVFEYLHRETPFYVSCGAKFGSDYLIYDGPRDQRHAFAGLRVLSPTTERLESDSDTFLPFPSAYALNSYVRCLNTAGKLALLATVVPSMTAATEKEPSRPEYQVLLVDVALEKVLEAPTHMRQRRRKRSQQKRKDITKNLAKT
ncbi:tRNA intron endonuclease [Nitzschia inconspicua]|uniref:tRNA intron endonuclease n=1 Tax=Nitzschia inconspicua TaxID=303405 RepID=A0A9K3L6S2_9STRA|nr:tRNA intron endonuclease [Nitzschia inconspicua]